VASVGPEGAAPLEELSDRETSPARPAASVIILRDSREGPEVLLVQRNPDARFRGGAWVFPGGAVQTGDATPAATARRELAEEAGLTLPDDADLTPFSRWITPLEVKVRFDTFFFLAAAPLRQEPHADGAECVDLRWLRPQKALAAGRRGELLLVFPTIKHLEQLAELESVADGLARARTQPVEPVLPRVVGEGREVRVLLPGEPGYDAPG
jgi:8-oxo-dGTP pyrophosphatase MutT (NUDIX family)